MDTGVDPAAAEAQIAERPNADKGMYDLSLLAAALLVAPDGWGGHGAASRVEARARAAARFHVGAVLQLAPAGFYDLDRPGITGEVLRARSFRLGAGAAYAPFGTGLHGVSLGLRALVGPVHYDVTPYVTGTTTTGSSPYPRPGPPAVPNVPDGVRVDLQPHLQATWVGHPGLTVGVEVGLAAACCDVLPEEPWLGPVAGAFAGWSVPVGEPAMHPAAAFALLDAEAARRRRLANRVLLGSGIAGLAVTAVASAVGLATWEL